MQEFIPAGFVLVIVLRHVVRQARHQRTSCQPIPAVMSIGGGTTTVEFRLYTGIEKLAIEFYTY
jgi:hypothetical protein